MRIVFRVDASLEMGTGHVMRCLTLAAKLSKKGADVQFICRRHNGDLINTVQEKGYQVHILKRSESVVNEKGKSKANQPLSHASWLTVTQEQDAYECKSIMQKILPDWLIVDHYAIDEVWQSELKGLYQKLMVIDDLADRQHISDLLLDQTYGRLSKSYQSLVLDHCKLLLGSQYSLLRPEFSQWREFSLKRRKSPCFKELLVSMGGVDPDNVTGDILTALNDCNLPKDIRIVVVMGKTAPHFNIIKLQAEAMAYKTTVKYDVTNMAKLMSNTDVAIGAAGATTWERCCLGVPSLLWVLADNQKMIANNLKENIVCLVDDFDHVCSSLKVLSENLSEYSLNAMRVTDGTGASKVAKVIYE